MKVIAVLCWVLLFVILAAFVLGNWIVAGMSGISLWKSIMFDLTAPFLFGGPLLLIALSAQILHHRKLGKRIWPFIILLVLATPVVIWGILDSL